MATASVVSVPALCEFSYQGRSYVRGEMVDVSPAEALMLARKGKVSLTRHDAPTRPNTYRRRDMRAER